MWRAVLVLVLVGTLGIAAPAQGNGRLTVLSSHVKRVLGDGSRTLVQKLVAGAGVVIIACSGMACSRGVVSSGEAQPPAPTEDVRVPKKLQELVGQDVFFLEHDSDWPHAVGRVTGVVSATELSVYPRPRHYPSGGVKEIVLDIDQVHGVRIVGHGYEGLQVTASGPVEELEYIRGHIVAVYDSSILGNWSGSGDYNEHGRLHFEIEFTELVDYEGNVSGWSDTLVLCVTFHSDISLPPDW